MIKWEQIKMVNNKGNQTKWRILVKNTILLFNTYISVGHGFWKEFEITNLRKE